MKKWVLLITLFLVIIFFSALFSLYEFPTYYNPERNYEDIQDELMTRFILAKDSSTIELPAGHFLFTKSLVLEGRNNITIKGAGIDKTVLSFKGQEEGAEGLRVSNGKNIVLEDFTVEDAAGDNIKVMDTDSVVFRRIKAAWTGQVSVKNGAYGLYPVLCNHVIIEECEAMGSADAGIYVGQSNHVIIRNSKAYKNVAGIESENSNDVLIYDNEAFDNTGGILVFNLPGLTQYGTNIKVYNNRVYNNNRKNFGVKGAIVSNIPEGTGMLILASNSVEVFDNKISNHRTLGVGIVSYELVYAMEKNQYDEGVNAYGSDIRIVDADFRNDTSYDPYPGKITLRNNMYSNNHFIPAFTTDFGKIITFKNRMIIPDVVFDGILSEQHMIEGKQNPNYKICIDENDIKFVNLDAGNDFKGLSRRVGPYICKS